MIKEFKRFYIKWFDFNQESLQLSLYYSFDNDVNFEEKIDFNAYEFISRDQIDNNVLKNIIPHICIAFAITYYKLYPTKEIVIDFDCSLDQEQMLFWQKYYLNGLWEFLYKNQIYPKWLMKFVNNLDWYKSKSIDLNLSNRCLLPFGWWKDSLLSIELIKKLWFDFDLFVFWQDYKLHADVADTVWKSRLIVSRQIDAKLFYMNDQGYFNGHVPITWQISFLMTLVSYLFDYKYIVFSNEKSSNYANLEYDGIFINHQYSKSLDFEKDFDNYIAKYISNDLKAFSILRNMYEIKIIELFSKYKQYLNIFSSCNKNFYLDPNRRITNRWCWKCPKCVFVFACLSAFVDKEELTRIFGKDLYEEKSLENLFKELLGLEWTKPFECVGTNEEMVLAMNLWMKKYEENQLPYNLKIFQNKILNSMSQKDLFELEEKLMKIYNEANMPEEFGLLEIFS